jgi:DNA-binding Xre family transcriptional regulator
MSLVFNHTKETLSEAMGMSENNLEDLAVKMSEISKNFLLTQEMKKSELAEKVALELSYSELIFIATGKIIETIESAVSINSSSMEQLIELMKKLRDE